MQGMFRGCEGLTKLDLSHFDTTNVTNMDEMFINCKNLKELYVTNFKTDNLKNAYRIISHCDKLQNWTTIDNKFNLNNNCIFF